MRIGVMYDRDLPPAQLPAFARELDLLGVDDLWVVEDMGWTGGISSAATALAVTSRLRVGIGIAPAPLRNPMLLAMEFGNLAALHPGRFVAGIGHGVQPWMYQVGAAVPSPLTLLEETVTAVRALLRGETVTLHGKAVHLDGVRLVHPPAEVPPIVTGVMSPKSLALSGRVAQGTIVPEGFGPAQISAALKQIDATSAHEMIVFTHLFAASDAALADQTRDERAADQGVPPEEVAMASGSPAEAAATVRRLHESGADTVVLRPMGSDPISLVRDLMGALRR